MSSKLISVYIDGKQVTVKKLDLKETLDSVRKKLAEKISNSNLFALEGGDKIELSDESGLNLEDILINGKKLYMVTNLNVSSPKPTPPKKNTPLKDAKLIENIGHLKIYQYPNVTLSDIEESRAISLLVVGQTGSGKTTLLNAFINALMDIEITDDFRYKIIIENFNHRMTDSVNIYNIKPQGNLPPIKIIDTPGFGDDRGIAQDKIIRDQIVDTFKKRLNTINAICFVAKSSNARLTADQRYIFTSILDLFGKDVQENFVAMLTFSDGGEPRIVPVLKEEIFDKIIPHIKGRNWYYKFNNSAIYSEDVNDVFTQMFWKLGMKSFKGFIQQLVKIPRKSLTQSKEVLKERQSLENSIKNLSNSLQMGLRTMESIRQTLDAIQNANLNINASKGFEVRTKVTVWKTIDAPVGQYTTTCVRCNRTCHENCSYGPGESKEGCCAIGGNGYCTECPGRCHHSIHQNLPILLVSEEKEVVVTDKDLEKRYYDEKSKLSKQAIYINGLKNDFMHITMSCMNIQEQIKNSVDKLKKIALNSNSYESSEDYIDFLIESEKSERKKGYLERIKGLEELKKQHQILREVYKNENSTTKSFEQFKKEFLEKEQNAKKDENCCIF